MSISISSRTHLVVCPAEALCQAGHQRLQRRTLTRPVARRAHRLRDRRAYKAVSSPRGQWKTQGI